MVGRVGLWHKRFPHRERPNCVPGSVTVGHTHQELCALENVKLNGRLVCQLQTDCSHMAVV